jgi:hypothetical protein
MTPEIKQKLVNWATAKQLVDKNPQLLLAGKTPEESSKNSEICSQRMKDFYVRLAELDSICLENSEKAPKEYLDFMEASIDSGCAKCWLSSGIKKHKECQSKINRYFETEKVLYNFALKLK